MTLPMQIALTDHNKIPWGFAPMRDIAYFHHQLLEGVQNRLLCPHNWETWVKDFMTLTGIAQEDLLRTHACYLRFCSMAIDEDRVLEMGRKQNMEKDLEDSGFLACPQPAQMLYLAKLGQVSTGAWWAGLKSATKLGRIPASIVQLKSFAEEAERFLSEKWSKNDKGPSMPNDPCIAAQSISPSSSAN